MNKLNLVVVPFHDWKKCEREGFRTRDAHFMQEFGKHSAVDKLLVIDRPTSLSEIVLLRRGWRVKQGQLLSKRGTALVTQVADKTFVLDVVVPEIIRPLWMQRQWTPHAFGLRRMADSVSHALSYLGIDKSYATFISAPLFVTLVQQLDSRAFILDAQDNLLKHTMYRDVPDLREYYDYCQRHCDLLYANSMETTQWLAQKRPDTTHIANGVDMDIFDPSRPYAVPEDLASIPRPIIGYAGKMQEMFDVTLMERTLSQFPQASFVFIGQQLNPKWIRPLWCYSNAHYLADKPYQQLPNYLAAFDICIIPYSIQRQHGGDPIKLYEYLAMGKPVVTTDIGGAGAFKDYPQVRVAQTDEEFIAGLRFFVEQIQSRKIIQVQPLPAECSWKAKADQIIRAVERRWDMKAIGHAD